MQSESLVLDPGLAPDGHRKIDWAARHSPVLNRVRDEYLNDGTFEGLGVGVALPIEAKTAYLTVVLAEAGAEVAVASPGPFFVQDDVAAALAERGVTVYASSANPPEQADRELERVLDSAAGDREAVLIDDRAGLVRRRRAGALSSERWRLRGSWSSRSSRPTTPSASTSSTTATGRDSPRSR